MTSLSCLRFGRFVGVFIPSLLSWLGTLDAIVPLLACLGTVGDAIVGVVVPLVILGSTSVLRLGHRWRFLASSTPIIDALFSRWCRFRDSWIRPADACSSDRNTAVGPSTEASLMDVCCACEPFSMHTSRVCPDCSNTYLFFPSKPTDPRWGEHKADPSRAQDDLSSGFGMEDRGVPREWNDEYQCLLELPNDTPDLVSCRCS